MTKNPGSEITPDALIARPYPLAGGGTGHRPVHQGRGVPRAFAGDLPRKTTDLMQATQRPFSVAAFTEASGEPAWKTIPSWYLVATHDHAIPPKPSGSWPSAPASDDQLGRGLARADDVPAQGHPGHHHGTPSTPSTDRQRPPQTMPVDVAATPTGPRARGDFSTRIDLQTSAAGPMNGYESGHHHAVPRSDVRTHRLAGPA